MKRILMKRFLVSSTRTAISVALVAIAALGCGDANQPMESTEGEGAAGSAAAAGQIIFTDEEGNPIAPPEGATIPRVQALDHSAEGLTIEDNPNDPGGKLIRLEGRFRSHSVGVPREDGSIEIRHVDGVIDTEAARKMKEAPAKILQDEGKED